MAAIEQFSVTAPAPSGGPPAPGGGPPAPGGGGAATPLTLESLIRDLREYHRVAVFSENYAAEMYYDDIIMQIMSLGPPATKLKELLVDLPAHLLSSKANTILRRYAKTGRHRGLIQLRRIRNTDEFLAFQTFLSLYGVGPVVARRWAAAGVPTSLLDVDLMSATALLAAANQQKLTATQVCGLQYRVDLAVPILQGNVNRILRSIRRSVMKQEPFLLLGSARRKLFSGSAVQLMATAEENPLAELARRATTCKKYVAMPFAGKTRLTLLWREVTKDPCQHPECREAGRQKSDCPGVVRQVNIVWAPAPERGATMLYYTGPSSFNDALVKHAKARGMQLVQQGLLYRNKSGSWRHLEGTETEQGIFEALGLAWVAPPDRIGPHVLQAF